MVTVKPSCAFTYTAPLAPVEITPTAAPPLAFTVRSPARSVVWSVPSARTMPVVPPLPPSTDNGPPAVKVTAPLALVSCAPVALTTATFSPPDSPVWLDPPVRMLPVADPSLLLTVHASPTATDSPSVHQQRSRACRGSVWQGRAH